MKLQEFTASKPTQQASKIFESYFGLQYQFDRLNATQAKKLLIGVRTALNEVRHSHKFFESEKNPAYLKLVVLEQALAATAAAPVAGTAAPVAGTAAPVADPAAAAKAAALQTAQQQQRKKQIQDQIKDKQKEIADLQKQMNMPIAEQQRRSAALLKESEIQQAQVVLAAQDMVDQMQSMLEDASEMQFKELPALVDSIKNQVGVDQAAQFNTDATTALTGLIQNIQGAKQQLDQALAVITGTAAMPMPGTETQPMMEPGVEPMPEPAAEPAPEAPADLEAGAGETELGRGRR
jgi:hypothetical protein